MTGTIVAQSVVKNYEAMFDLSLSKDKMMDMMPGLLLFLARRPECVRPVLDIMMPMMDKMKIAVNDDLLVEMMPSVVKAVNQEPGLGSAIFFRMVPMMERFGLKMNFYVIKKVIGMMLLMMLRHPRCIPAMLIVMPRMMDFSFISNWMSKIKGVFGVRSNK